MELAIPKSITRAQCSSFRTFSMKLLHFCHGNVSTVLPLC